MTDDAGCSAADHSTNARSMMFPTRIITYAWGQKYIDELLSLTLPALLAPGNLPSVASATSCEVVILTEEASFPCLRANPTIRRMEEICPVRLVELDDLIPSPDKYGIALTYVLHRGFSDLGPAVTDNWLIFLNADFVLADGSLCNLLRHLAAGARIVASPSYCVNAEAVKPELARHVDPQTRVLSLPAREMADLVLRNRHNTIRGKTLNDPPFSIQIMDQFYWLADDYTLLGHQMPIAIVGMRPEQHLAEPNAYWDHGLIGEFCPTAEACVLGDSDEFLMLELRGQAVAQEQLRTGWPQPAEIARNTISFLTKYQRDMAVHPLTLHSRNLPLNVEAARRQLKAFVDETLSHVPPVLPSHIGHPQWDYHRPGFLEARHNFLSKRLGALTESRAPPSTLNDIDQMWWKLDGLKKCYDRTRAEISSLLARHRDAASELLDQLEQTFSEQQIEAWKALVPELAQRRADPNGTDLRAMGNLVAVPLNDASAPHLLSNDTDSPLMQLVADRTQSWRAMQEKRVLVGSALDAIERHYGDELERIDANYELAHSEIRAAYDQLLNKGVTSAAIPHVLIRHGPQSPDSLATRGRLLRLAKKAHYHLFGRPPRVNRLSPYWGSLRHLVRIVNDASTAGAADVLAVFTDGGTGSTAADGLGGTHAYVSLTDLLQGNLSKRLDGSIAFDLCICELPLSEIGKFGDIANAVAPFLRDTGRIVVFCASFDSYQLGDEQLFALNRLSDRPTSPRVYFSGSKGSAWVLRQYRRALSSIGEGGIGSLVRAAPKLLILVPGALIVNLAEESRGHARLPRASVTSVTIDEPMEVARSAGPPS